MKKYLYQVLRETDTLEVVCFIGANSLQEAKEKAIALGYGKNYIIEECSED